MAVQMWNKFSRAAGTRAMHAAALVLSAAAVAAAQPRELNAATRAQRLDVQRSLAGRPAVKIAVSRPGWYRVTQPQLVAAGLPPNTNPHNLRLFAYGVEQPLRVIGTAQGRFEPGDAIEFYGTGVDTPFTGSHIYWLTSDSPGMRVPVFDARTSAAPSARSFPFTVERQDRTIWFAALKNKGANKYFGDFLSTDGPVDETLTLTNVDFAAPGSAQLEVALQGINEDPTVNPNHRVGVLINGLEAGEVTFNGQSQGVRTFTVPQRQLVAGANTVTFVVRGGELDFSAVNYVRLTYWHTYTAEGDALRFSAAGGQPFAVDGFSRADIRLIDITDPSAPRELVGTTRAMGATFRISAVAAGAGVHTVLAFTGATIGMADSVRRNAPSSWSASNNDADYLILTHGDFVDAVKPLKALREAKGLRVALIDVEDIYDEFNFGEKTPDAIKDFMVRARAVWRTPPRFLLLVGNATIDPRNYFGTGQVDYVPVQVVDTAFLEVPSDDWYADTDGDGRPDLAAVGRLPARSVLQARVMVSKILAYEATGEGGWSKNVLLVADQNDSDDDFEGATKALEPSISPDYQVHKVLRGAVGTDDARADLLGRMNDGQLIVNYFGHGSVDMWHDDLLTGEDAATMTNGSRLPLVVAMSCLNGFFHTFWPDDSIAGSLMRAQNGGAIAVWASSSLTSPSGQSQLDQELFRLLFTGAYPTLGEAVAAAKKATTDNDVRRSWILFGDPALHLKGLPLTPVQKSKTTETLAKTKLPVQPPTAASVPTKPTLGTPKPSSEADARPDAADGEWSMLSADLNADGLADLLLYHRDTGEWVEALTRANGSADYFRGQWPPHASVRTVDLNCDGRSDVFLYQRETGAWLQALADGVGGFKYKAGTWPSGWEIEFADFNGDRLVDVLLYSPQRGTGSIGLNDGAGGFTSITGPWSSGWTVRVADFDGDSVADLLLYDRKTGAWVEGLGDGAGHFTYYRGKWAPGYDVYTGDFNADRRADVFLYDTDTGAWSLATTTGAGQFMATSGTWTPGWIVAAGDLNGDHRADVFLYNPDSGQSMRCLTNAAGRFDCAPGKWPRAAAATGLMK